MHLKIEKNLPSLAAVEGLDETLRAFAAFRGLSTRPGVAIVYLDDRATPLQQAEIEAAARRFDATQLTARQQRRAENLASIRATAQSAVDVALADLTAAQVRSLLACLLYQHQAVTDDGKIRPLAEWLS
jgi:hypothetical protein